MAGSTFGKLFRITSFGESHGRALGVVIDGCPAGLALSEADIQPYMDRRRPGQDALATQRKEADAVEILSGVFEGRTTGTPIAILLRNTDQRSHDYTGIQALYRPGHADFCFDMKYGFRDYRGGGRSSGRETAARVAAGAVAAKLLKELGIQVHAQCTELAGVDMQDSAAAEAAVLACKAQADSAGGIVECRVEGLMPGIGEPVFDKLDARLAHAIMSIGAVKGVEIGDGFAVARARGSENNDAFFVQHAVEPDSAAEVDFTEGGSAAAAGASDAGAQAYAAGLETQVKKRSNHSGGVLGGMSDGAELVIRAAFKPTPSIAGGQQTVNRAGENVHISIAGRHDPTVVQRAVVVVECMTALTVLDALMENMSARLDNLKRCYGR